MATSDGGLGGSALGIFSPSILNISSGIATGLSGYADQQQQAGAIDSLLIADVFLADLILMGICAQLAAVAHRPELTLIRARGGSTRQVAGRQLARAACVTGPAIVAGAALAIAAVPGSSAASWLLGAIAALAALAIPGAIAAWAHRRAQPGRGGRSDLASLRPPKLLLVAEGTVVVVAAAALAGLRLRGIAPGGGLYAAAPVLVAAAAGLITARLYPVPVRGLLRIAAARPGPVGFLGLARAARSGLGAVLPALALVITLTLAGFATMVVSSISIGQAAAAWQQTGADVMIQTAGNGTVTPAALRAVGSVRGVRRTAAVYTALANGEFAGELATAGHGPVSVGLVMVDPARYAALARQTPWPDFPARRLGQSAGSGPAVPILVSAALAARSAPASGQAGTGAGRGSATLNVGGIVLPVRLAGTVGATPAMTGGGPFVVFPAWAAASYPSIAGPNTLLATGSGIDLRAVRAAAARTMQAASVTSRAQLLSALVKAPAQFVAERLYLLGVWVAVLLSALATLFGLAESGGRRAHLAERLGALGMPGRQSRALALTDLLPVLLVAVIGSLASGIVLAVVVGPVLNLAVFTGSASQVPVRPGPGMLLPAAGIVVLAIVIVAAQATAVLRRNIAAALRQEEAG